MNKILELELSNNIAVVGSSSNILNSTYGEEIDNHDDVVRFNRAIIEGYENFVGIKTTLTVANCHVFSNRDPNENEKIKYLKQEKDFIANIKNSNILYMGGNDDSWKNGLKQIHESSKAYHIDIKFLDELKKRIKKLPSIGFVFIHILVENNIKPDVYGFGIDENEKNITHYWEKRRPESKFHNYNIERKILKELNNKKLINIKL